MKNQENKDKKSKKIRAKIENNKINIMKLMWISMTRNQKFLFFAIMLLGIFASLAVLIPTQVISIIVSKLSGETISVLGIVISNSVSYTTIIVVGGILTLVMRVINATYDLSVERLIKKVVANIRKNTYGWVITPRKNMDLKMTSGDALYRLNQAPDVVTDVVNDFFTTILQDTLSGIIAFIYIIFLDVKSLPILAAGMVLVAICVVVRTVIERHISYRTEIAKSSMSSMVSNSITNLPLINLYKSMVFESSIYSKRVDKFFGEQKKQINLRWVYWFFVRIFQITTTFGVIYLCARRVFAGTMLVGNIVIITNYVAQIFTPIQTIGYFATRWIQCSVAVNRLYELKPTKKELLPLKSANIKSIETVEFSHVCANNTGGFNLKNVNLKFKKGELVVISGESGCGKSTLIKVICGLFEKTSGEILINGEKNIESTYMAVDKMSVSMQDAYIFDRDVNLNILYPTGEMPEDDWKGVVDDLSLGGVMKRKYTDDGEQTLSNMLSGGEKKRIGIARALIKKADLYIFDEPTNDLDNSNAQKVINAICKLKDNAIVVVVTHDNRVKNVADRLITFKERGVIESDESVANL